MRATRQQMLNLFVFDTWFFNVIKWRNNF